MIGEGWYGSYVPNIKRLFIGMSKTIAIVAIEGLVSEMESKTSFFDDYSDEDPLDIVLK